MRITPPPIKKPTFAELTAGAMARAVITSFNEVGMPQVEQDLLATLIKTNLDIELAKLKDGQG